MPKFPSFPTLYDEVLQLSITKLKEWGYLEPGKFKSGSLTWSRNGNKTGSISIHVNTQSEEPYIQLDYKYQEEPRSYKVKIVSLASNLGKGKIWYFLCPHTNKRCRKLYCVGGYFLHREAFTGCMYESQTRSKEYRNLEKAFGAYLKIDALYDELYKKHFKSIYAGRPTKRYKRLRQQIEKAESIPYNQIIDQMTTSL